MTDKLLRVAIVGCGQFAEEHVKEIRKIPGTQIVAVCDLEELLAAQLAERYGIPAFYSSIEKLYDNVDPDVVHITTPPQTHLQLGRLACERGSHIYVEKPFTVTFSEAVDLIAAADKQGVKLTTGHIYRFDPPALKMRKLVAQGVLGRPVHVEALMGYNLEGPFGREITGNPGHWVRRLPGQLFHNNISHIVDRVMEFIPDENPQVMAYAGSHRSVDGSPSGSIPGELRVIVAGKDVTGNLLFSTSLSPNYSLLRVFGTRNAIEVDYNSRVVVVRKGAQLPSVVGRLLSGFDLARQHQTAVFANLVAFLRSRYHYFAGMNYLLRAFYSAVRGEGELPIPYSDILRTARVMDSIFNSLGMDR